MAEEAPNSPHKQTKGLPFYSQLLYSHIRARIDRESCVLEPEKTILVRSLNPLLTASDIECLCSKDGYIRCFSYSEIHPNASSQERHKHSYYLAYDKPVEADKVFEKYSGEAPTDGILNIDCYGECNDLYESMQEYRSHYKSKDILQKYADEYMLNYDLKMELNKRLREQSITDEEGFTTVVSGPRPERVLASQKKKKSKDASDIYKLKLGSSQ
ncbi:hypothetical protein BEWA_020910 [Theileria equi strain WA]|uniref:Ribosomal RNA-processing protein 7 C-terminal domain-containing protein n=1 Tax=Theileria equi strain WA TaxID=1537102 RepID=L0AWF7_THEEQ|nr:hypothetical protein BEWA_020910 [Theileria equi strain WA]AFZ79244.1 hypothetical protein BEWA_020910 [Theileria equi strain WA]|eukprot:XP_004828910.1 hypothetical protein BEWA_020910 [Theileria equi strain WA]